MCLELQEELKSLALRLAVLQRGEPLHHPCLAGLP